MNWCFFFLLVTCFKFSDNETPIDENQDQLQDPVQEGSIKDISITNTSSQDFLEEVGEIVSFYENIMFAEIFKFL